MILGIDTTSRTAYVALVDGAVVKREAAKDSTTPTDQVLVGLIDELCRSSGITPADLTSVAVALGPGSYTGIRTGIATAQGLFFGLGVPVVGVSVFYARMAAMSLVEGFSLATLESVPGEVYCQLFYKEAKRTIPKPISDLFNLQKTDCEKVAFDMAQNWITAKPGTGVPSFSKKVGQHPVDLPLQTSEGPAALIALASASLETDDKFTQPPSVLCVEYPVDGVLHALYGKSVNALTLAQRKSKESAKKEANVH